MSYQTGHLEAFYPEVQAEAVAWVMRTLRTGPCAGNLLTHNDAIAFRGQSGAAVAYPISALTGIPLAHVRKPECSSHLGQRYQIVGNARPRRYVIVDDFIDSGATLAAIHKQIRELRSSAECVGVLLYRWTFLEDALQEFVFRDAGWNTLQTAPVIQRVRNVDGARTEHCNLSDEIAAWAAFSAARSAKSP